MNPLPARAPGPVPGPVYAGLHRLAWVMALCLGTTLPAGARPGEGEGLEWWAIWNAGGRSAYIHCLHGRIAEGRSDTEYCRVPDTKAFHYWNLADASPASLGAEVRYARFSLPLDPARVPRPEDVPGESPIHRVPWIQAKARHAPFAVGPGALSLGFEQGERVIEFAQFTYREARPEGPGADRVLATLVAPALAHVDSLDCEVSIPRGESGRRIFMRLGAHPVSPLARALAIRALPVFGMEAWRSGLADPSDLVRAAAISAMFATVRGRGPRIRATLRVLDLETSDRGRHAAFQCLYAAAPLEEHHLDLLQESIDQSRTSSSFLLAMLLAEHGRRRGLDWFAGVLAQEGEAVDESDLVALEGILSGRPSPDPAQGRVEALRAVLADPGLAWDAKARVWRLPPRKE